MAKHKGIPSIRQRKDKTGKKIDLWECQLNLGRDLATGKPKRVSIYGKTQKECKEKVIEALGQIQNQTFVEPNKMTLGEWLDTWLKEYKKDKVRPSTYTGYEVAIRIHLKDIGKAYLRDLRPEVIQKFYNEKAKYLSSSTIRSIHMVLCSALEQAIKNNLIIRNVSKATVLPKKKQKEMRVLTMEEQKKLIDAIRSHRLGTAFLLSLATGMRVGELLGLTWKNVNLKEGYIRVNQTISRVKTFKDKDTKNEEHSKKTEIIVQEPKTRSGKRTIPLVDSMVAELKAHKEKQRKERKELGLSELYDGYVFTSLGVEAEIVEGKEIKRIAYNPIDTRNFRRTFDLLVKKAGIAKTNLHALRHTFATRLLEINEHPKIVQEMLGHSSINITLDTYSHVMPELKKAAVNKLDNLFQKGDTAQNQK